MSGHNESEATIFLQRNRELSLGDLLVFILWNRQGHILIMNRQVLTEHTRGKLVRQDSKSITLPCHN